jgi:glycosyltransferase involved in cell wall biosynthesis
LEHLDLLSVQDDLKRTLEAVKPDVLICHFAPLAITAYPVAKALQLPLICICYGYDVSRNLRKPYWRRQYKNIFPRFNAIVGISEHICGKVRRYTSTKHVHLMHLGVNVDSITHTYPSKRVKQEIVFMHIGRLVEKKGPLLLIKSFEHALPNYKGSKKLKLILIGDGPLLSVCAEYVKKESLLENVILLGALPHVQTLAELGKAHIYTQHSITAADGDEEGQGVSLVEASSLGLPVIVTAHNGFPDVVLDGQNGFLIPEHDTLKMGAKMAWLADNMDVWDDIGQRGILHMTEHFSLNREVGKLASIVNQMG